LRLGGLPAALLASTRCRDGQPLPVARGAALGDCRPGGASSRSRGPRCCPGRLPGRPAAVSIQSAWGCPVTARPARRLPAPSCRPPLRPPLPHRHAARTRLQ
jgi:hypothetical protein